VAACLYLMFELPRITWYRFTAWLIAGLLIYFLYGMWHSRMHQADGRTVGRSD